MEQIPVAALPRQALVRFVMPRDNTMNLRIFFLMIAINVTTLGSAAEVPHFVKSITYAQDGKTIAQPAAVEKSVAWILKKDPNYWVRLEAFYCDGDREKDDDPVEKLVDKANDRATVLKLDLQKRKVRPDAISISVMGKSSDPSVCLTKILAGPTPVEPAKPSRKPDNKPSAR